MDTENIKNTDNLVSIIVATLVVLSITAVVAVGATGTAAAQSGTVSITGEVSTESDVFDVEITSLQNTQTGCLQVTNLETGTTFERNDVTAGDQIAVFKDDLNGWETGDGIEATLYEEPFDCATELGSDTQTVQGTADFQVEVDSINSPVTEGEIFTTTATIENRGDETDTQTVDLLIDDVIRDDRAVTLDSGESQQLTLSWQTEPGDAGKYLSSVDSEDDSGFINVVVEEADGPNFDVESNSTNSPVTEGERLNVTATIENTGNEKGNQTVDLRIGDFIEDEKRVTLDSEESQQLTLSWQTEFGDAGTYQAAVASENDSESTNVVVEERESPSFDVDIASTNSPIVEGETVDVTATVENIGRDTGTQSIGLTVGNRTRDAQNLTVDGGQTNTVTLNWDTGVGDAGSYRVEVASDNDTDSTDVTVLEKGSLDVSINRTNAPVVEGESLDVTATLTNTGDVEVTGPIALRIGNRTVDTGNVTVADGESVQATLTWDTQPGDGGEHTATFTSDSDEEAVAAAVNKPAMVTVDEMSTNSPVLEGEPLRINSTVINTGDLDASQSVELRIGNRSVDTTNISVAGGESRAAMLRWETEAGDRGEHVAEVASEDDAESAEVSVLRDAAFVVNITSTNSPVSDGESLDVTATVTNTGDVSGTEQVSLTVDGVERDSQELTLDADESRELTLSWADADADPGEYELEVRTQGDSAASLATLAEPDDSPPMILLLALVVLVVLILVILFVLRRKDTDDSEQSPETAGGES